jgi:putative membrane protein
VTTQRETQPERTALSWQRTALGAVAVGALIGHRGVVGGHPALLVPAGICALIGVAMLSGVGAVRDRRVWQRTHQDEPVADARLATLGTAAVVVVTLLAAVSVLVGRLG